MILEITLALLIGVIAGIISGLCPGIHINLVSAFLIASSAVLLTIFTPLTLAVFIVSMSLTHSFLDFIPSIYLGAPEEASSLAVMPGHKMLLKGKGHKAVFYTALGGAYGIILSIIITPFLIFTLPLVYPFIQKMMAWILVVGTCFLLYREKNSKLWALIIFLLAGFLGVATLNLQVNQPLLPLLSGLFGSSSLIYSISQKTTLPPQKIKKIKPKIKKLIKPSIVTSIFSPICSFLPGLGSSQAAILSSEFSGKTSKKQFLFLLGSVSMITMVLSFSTLYILQKSRTGSAAAIDQLLTLSSLDLIYLLTIALIVSIISFFLTIKISKIFAKNISKINYSKISLAVLILLFIFVLIFSGFLGLPIFIISTCTGLLAIYTNIRKGHLMGCLLLPTILYYLPFF